ncbi:hypothetical protein HYT04_00325 [Candidatus Kaiserbacteria bacterium]|nr:hypothetical protein [Candidatus Kaiserbacteria bacterium]
MALPPTIPTSFVPHSTAVPQKFRSDFTGAFGFFAYAVFGIVFLLALGVFLYGRILASDQSSKDAALAEQVKNIDQTTVENFIRLRDRLVSSGALLAKHAAFSEFFSSLEKILPSTVRFTTLRLSIDSTGVPEIEGSGVAKNFNALAAASTAFAKDGRIKDAIFSNIDIGKDSSVSFSLAATLDQKMVVFSP